MIKTTNSDISKFQLVDPKTGEEKRFTITEDDDIRPNASLSDLAKLKAVFKKFGTTTDGMLSIAKLHGEFFVFPSSGFPLIIF
jgi:hypothetical protein